VSVAILLTELYAPPPPPPPPTAAVRPPPPPPMTSTLLLVVQSAGTVHVPAPVVVRKITLAATAASYHGSVLTKVLKFTVWPEAMLVLSMMRSAPEVPTVPCSYATVPAEL